MKKRIRIILIMMTLCVTGITGLQLYWNYSNYQTTVRNFRHDINEALEVAVNREIDRRQNVIAAKFKTWLYDTSFVQITTNTKNRYHETVFTVKDTYPLVDKQKGLSFGITFFKERLDTITTKAKKIFVDHFADTLLKDDLKKGIIYFYTQRLGDSLTIFFEKNKLDTAFLKSFYAQELAVKGIKADFVLNPQKSNLRLYLTQTVNTALRRPYQKAFIYAGFESPNLYFIKQMKWLVITSLLLIFVTLICYAYTVYTILSQQKLNMLKDDFISNMTHELNTPLSSIKITTEALKNSQLDERLRAEYLDIIAYQADRLSGLSEQILHVQRIQTKAVADKRKIKINDVIQTAINDLSPQINNSQAEVSFQHSEDTYIIGEANALQNAFENLIDNAIKYTELPPRINISLSIHQKMVVIKFADNGIGISREYHTVVFDRFFRVPKGNLHNVKGYGLGLAYVKQVIDHLKGTISVADNQPAGTIFTIKIPLS